jgi:hypothetical protein
VIDAPTALDLFATQPLTPDADVVLSEEEMDRFHYLDASIESTIYEITARSRRADEIVFDVRIPADFISEGVLYEIRRVYENGGWAVGLFALTEQQDARALNVKSTGAIVAWQMVFSAAP